MLKVTIINGPNLNLTGIREKDIYGDSSFEDFLVLLRTENQDVKIDYFQSNIEGELINKIHSSGFSSDGIILNAGGYSHTSVSLADAIAAVKIPVVEVHLSNIYSREEFRHKSLTAGNCIGLISGFGMHSYRLALYYLKNLVKS